MCVYQGGNNKLKEDKLIMATDQKYIETQVNYQGGRGGRLTHKVRGQEKEVPTYLAR